MFFESTITIDPSQITEIDKFKPTKGFARIAHIMSAGLTSPTEERETFCAIAILQQVNLVMRSMGIDNIVGLSKDDVIFYEDREGRENDLKMALDAFVTSEQNKTSGGVFEELNLILEHHTDCLTCLIDIRILRTHPIGQHPITIKLTGFAAALDAANLKDDNTNFKITGVFDSQEQYDRFVEMHKTAFDAIVEQMRAAIHQHMHVDNVQVSTAVKIVRPTNRQRNRHDSGNSGSHYYADSYHDDGHLFSNHSSHANASASTWAWGHQCHDSDISISDCTIVDDTGRPICEVDTSVEASQLDALDINADLDNNITDGSSAVDDSAAHEATQAEITDSSRSNDGWLGGFFDSVEEKFSDFSESFGDFGGRGDSGAESGGGCGGGSG